MTDNDNSSENRSGGPSGSDGSNAGPGATGSPKGQRRRGRRRSRRRGQPENSNQSKTEAKPENKPAEKTEKSDDTANRNRQRRRRSSRGGKNRASQGQNQSKNRRGQSANRQHHRGNAADRNRGPDTSRMVTRDETSAGGLVMSGLAEAVDLESNVDLSRIYVALIGRLDRRGRLLWSMPKGHVEPGEGHEATAEREVWEETGIHGEVIGELGVIDYWFVSDGVRIHKTVHHHLLRYADGDLNDEDPEVTEVAWIPASELIEHLAYADERKLARIAHDRLPEIARQEKAEGRATPR